MFAVDPGRRPTVARLLERNVSNNLPDAMMWFEPSPDGQYICVPGEDGSLAVVRLADNETRWLVDDAAPGELRTLPDWRGNDEVSMACGLAEPEAELVRIRIDGEGDDHQRVVMSTDWPDDTRGFLSREDSGSDDNAPDETANGADEDEEDD